MENLLLSHFKKLWKLRNQVPNKQCYRNLLRVIIYEMKIEKESREKSKKYSSSLD